MKKVIYLIFMTLKTLNKELTIDVEDDYKRIVSLGHDMIFFKNFLNSTHVIWNIKTNQQEYFTGLEDLQTGEEILSDKLLITCANSVKIWDLRTKELVNSFTPERGSQVIKSVGDKIIVGLFDVEVWDLRSKKKEYTIPLFIRVPILQLL